MFFFVGKINLMLNKIIYRIVSLSQKFWMHVNGFWDELAQNLDNSCFDVSRVWRTLFLIGKINLGVFDIEFQFYFIFFLLKIDFFLATSYYFFSVFKSFWWINIKNKKNLIYFQTENTFKNNYYNTIKHKRILACSS